MASNSDAQAGGNLIAFSAFADREPDYEDKGLVPAIYALSTIFTTLSLIAVCLRCYSRARYTKVEVEDCLAVFAWLIGTVTTFALCKMAGTGIGQDVWNVRPEKFAAKRGEFAVAAMLTAASHVAAVTSIKVSIIMLYIRIYPFGIFMLCCYAAIVFITGTGISITLASVFGCSPISAQWDGDASASRCINLSLLYECAAVLFVLGDIITLSLPFPLLYGSTLSSKKKMHVGAVLSIGLLATVFCILRAYYTFYFARNDNWSKNVAVTNIYAMIEAHLGLICSCAPAIKGLLGRKFEYFRDSSENRTSQSTNTRGCSHLNVAESSVRIDSPIWAASDTELVAYKFGGDRNHILSPPTLQEPSR